MLNKRVKINNNIILSLIEVGRRNMLTNISNMLKHSKEYFFSYICVFRSLKKYYLPSVLHKLE